MINDSTFLTTINIIPNPIIVTDGQRVVVSNKVFLDFLGINSLRELAKTDGIHCVCKLFLELPDYFSRKDLKEGENWIHYICAHKNEVKVSMYNSDKEVRSFEVSAGLLEEYKNLYVVIFSDITSLENEKKILEKLAYRDPLTNIFNRQIFNIMLQQAYSDKVRNNVQLSMIMFDIDHFKNVNDTYGHDVGDKVLIELTRLINTQIRQSDIFARWGGEEFVILLPNTSLEAAYTKAEKLRVAVESYKKENLPTFTISLGVTEVVASDKERSCFRRVDKALYKAKEKRNLTVKM